MQNQQLLWGLGAVVLVVLAILLFNTETLSTKSNAVSSNDEDSGQISATSSGPVEMTEEPLKVTAEEQKSVPTLPSATANTIVVSALGKYALDIPKSWYVEELEYIKSDNLKLKDILVFDENDKLVMKITQPLREMDYWDRVIVVQPKLGTGIGALSAVLRSDAEDFSKGVMHYTWDGGDEFWANSFEIFVYYGDWEYYKTSTDSQNETNGLSFRYKSLNEIKSTGVYRSQIEDLIGGLYKIN